MTRQEAIKILRNTAWLGTNEDREKTEQAIEVVAEALEQIESGRYVKGECSICSKEYGTLGCCTTVSNHWVYSCKEGMAQYAEALEQEPICCKDCKYWHEWDNGTGACCRSSMIWVGSDYDDYCSFAERRESDEE